RLTPRPRPGSSLQSEPSAPPPAVGVPTPDAHKRRPDPIAPPIGAQPTVGPQSDLQRIQLDDDPDNMLCGTPTYLAPEQWETSRWDTRADIYSLGCAFYTLLTGAPPFRARTVDEMRDHHKNDEPPLIEGLRTDVSRNLGAIIRKMLAKRPED